MVVTNMGSQSVRLAFTVNFADRAALSSPHETLPGMMEFVDAGGARRETGGYAYVSRGARPINIL